MCWSMMIMENPKRLPNGYDSLLITPPKTKISDTWSSEFLSLPSISSIIFPMLQRWPSETERSIFIYDKKKMGKKKKFSLSPYQKNKRIAKQLLMLPMTNLLLTSPTIRQCEAWFSCYLAKVLTRSSEILGKLNIFRDMCQASNADTSIWGKCNYS